VQGEVAGTDHWTVKRAGADNVKLYLRRKRLKDVDSTTDRGTVLFVHGSSVSATPVFDLQIPGKPEASTMDWFARRGFDTWCVDCEVTGVRTRACGECGRRLRRRRSRRRVGLHHGSECGRKLLLYGASSGALRAGLFAQRHPERVQRLALDALVWTGDGSPTLAERKKRLAEYRASNRRPIDARSCAASSRATIRIRAISASSRRSPTPCSRSTRRCQRTYIDMSANLPVLDPDKITVPTLIMRGQWDGIASFQDLAGFFAKLPNPTSSLSSCPASRTRARARRTGRSSITCSMDTSASPRRSMSAEGGRISFDRLRAFIASAFERLGMPPTMP